MANARFLAGLLLHYAATTKHKALVAWFVVAGCVRGVRVRDWPPMFWRALVHDLSKYRWDEASAFATTIFELKRTEYGTGDYKHLLAVIRPAIETHYARNRHHPEFHRTAEDNGSMWRAYGRMTCRDRFEMVADWAAAVRRHENGDLGRSIVMNGERFGYDEREAAELRKMARMMGAL